jgi:hypothetical protein
MNMFKNDVRPVNRNSFLYLVYSSPLLVGETELVGRPWVAQTLAGWSQPSVYGCEYDSSFFAPKFLTLS